MADVLFLSQRLPFPPNKGDKIRSWHLLRHLARGRRVHVGTFVDDPADWAHTDAVRAAAGGDCAFLPLAPIRARLASARALIDGRSLSEAYFHSAELDAWVGRVTAQHRPSHAVVFCSAMTPYIMRRPAFAGHRSILDMGDVDSDKWRQYADRSRRPMRWVFAREADRLGRLERAAASWFGTTLLVAPLEAELMRQLAPDAADRIGALSNGVDLDHFDAGAAYADPYPPGALPILFTGMMSYWPNVDAVQWFADTVLPRILAARPGACFVIAGADPPPAVRRLAERPGITVTGRVADMRPWLAHAAVAVAPLRIARGVQNKVIEAMAMARPVVASPAALQGLSAVPGHDLLQAEAPEAFAAAVLAAAEPDRGRALGAAGLSYVRQAHDWSRNLALLDALLAGAPVRDLAPAAA